MTVPLWEETWNTLIAGLVGALLLTVTAWLVAWLVSDAKARVLLVAHLSWLLLSAVAVVWSGAGFLLLFGAAAEVKALCMLPYGAASSSPPLMWHLYLASGLHVSCLLYAFFFDLAMVQSLLWVPGALLAPVRGKSLHSEVQRYLVPKHERIFCTISTRSAILRMIFVLGVAALWAYVLGVIERC